MTQTEFEAAIHELVADIDPNALRSWVNYAQTLEHDDIEPTAEFFKDTASELTYVKNVFGGELAQQLFNAGAVITFNPFDLWAAAKLFHEGMSMEDVAQKVADGHCYMTADEYTFRERQYQNGELEALLKSPQEQAEKRADAMIHITLSTRNGGKKELDLPLQVKDVLKKPIPYYLAYGNADIEFQTPSKEHGALLKGALPEMLEGGLQELNFLACVLSNMNGQQLQCLEKSLAEDTCDYAETTRRALYFCSHAFLENSTPNPNAIPLEHYNPKWDRSDWEEKIRRRFKKELNSQRMTGGELFERVMERARENGDLARFDTIGDYSLADSLEQGKLCSYEFDLMPVVNFGGSEGIYIDCTIRGKFDESGRNAIHIGTLKTLETNLEACKTMGELCGALLYHESEYVNENLYLFDSTESIEGILSKPLRMEQAPAAEMTMGGQQM